MGENSADTLHEATQMFMTVDYVRKMTVKKSCMVNIDCLNTCSSCFRFGMMIVQSLLNSAVLFLSE